MRITHKTMRVKLNKGFSLIEVIVAITILFILFLLITKSMSFMQESAHSVTCASRLSTVSQALMAYAGDHNNRIHIYSSKGGSGASVQWLRFLVGTGSGITHERTDKTPGAVYLTDKDAAICPSENPYSWNSNNNQGYTYGALFYNSNDPYNSKPLFQGEELVNGSREIVLSNVENAAMYWLFTDSFGGPSVDRQFYYISLTASPGGQSGKVHFRHRGHANVLFADGHIESLTPEQFKALVINPIHNGFDQNKNYIHF